jgi:hypothetical protein
MDPRAPSTNVIEQTRETWQPQAERHLTDEDAREIIANMSGFLRILIDWDATARAVESCTDPAGDVP